jgi:hypothetical protein
MRFHSWLIGTFVHWFKIAFSTSAYVHAVWENRYPQFAINQNSRGGFTLNVISVNADSKLGSADVVVSGLPAPL